MRTWIVEWEVSGSKHIKIFTDYKKATEYLIETVETFGRDWHIQVSMKENRK